MLPPSSGCANEIYEILLNGGLISDVQMRRRSMLGASLRLRIHQNTSDQTECQQFQSLPEAHCSRTFCLSTCAIRDETSPKTRSPPSFNGVSWLQEESRDREGAGINAIKRSTSYNVQEKHSRARGECSSIQQPLFVQGLLHVVAQRQFFRIGREVRLLHHPVDRMLAKVVFQQGDRNDQWCNAAAILVDFLR